MIRKYDPDDQERAPQQSPEIEARETWDLMICLFCQKSRPNDPFEKCSCGHFNWITREEYGVRL